MLEAVLVDRGASSVSAIARGVGLPVATGHRQVATLVSDGFLVPSGHGRHVAGPRLQNLATVCGEVEVLANVALPRLEKVARRFACIAQMGTLDGDMVTYRIKTGAPPTRCSRGSGRSSRPIARRWARCCWRIYPWPSAKPMWRPARSSR